MSIRNRLVLVLWIVGISICAVLISKTPLSTDMSAFLPRSPSAEQQILVDQVRNGVASRLILLGIEGAPPDTLVQLSRSLAARLRAGNEFISVENGNTDALAADRDFIWRNRYLLSPGVAPGRFTAAALHTTLEKDLQLLGSPMATAVKRILPNDPTGELLSLIDQLVGAARPHAHDGIWLSPNERRAVLVVETRPTGFDIDLDQALLSRIDDAFAAARHEVPGALATYLLESGPSVFGVRTRALMERDATVFSICASALVAALLLFSYRSLRMLFFGLLPVATGALAGVAAVAIGFGYIHGITLGFGVTLIGESVDYAIYLFSQTVPGRHPTETLLRIWPTLRLGALTSIAGFSVMLFSSFAGFAQLGLFSIAGLLAALGVTRWVLPALVSLGPASTKSRLLAAPLLTVLRYASWLRPGIVVLTVAAAMMLLFHRGGFWQQDLAEVSPIPAAEQKLDRTLRNDVGAPDVRYLVAIRAAGEQQALEASAQVSSVLRRLTADRVIDGFNAPDQILPSEATQRARQADLPDAQTLSVRLGEALQGLPFRPDTFNPFLTDVAETKLAPLLTRDTLPTSLRLELESLLLEHNGDWTAVISLRGLTNPGRIESSLATLNGTHAELVDLKQESDRLLNTYERDAIRLAAFGGLAIIALLSVALQSPKRVLIVVLPLAASVILTATTLTFGDHKLSIFNLVGLLLIVSVSSNYCLFFERQNRNPERSDHLLASVVLANLCTVLGYGILSFSSIPVLHDIGITVAMGTLLTLALSALLNAGSLALGTTVAAKPD
jgi:predicted exporter